MSLTLFAWLILLAVLVSVGLTYMWFKKRDGLAAKQIRDELSQLRAVLDTSEDAIVTINLQGEIIGFNRTAENLFLWLEEQVKGKNVNMLMPEPFKSAHDIYLKGYSIDKSSKVISKSRELTAIKRNGVEFPISLTVLKVKRSDPVVFVGFIKDLTSQRNLEKHLAAAQRSYQALINNIPGVLFQCKPDQNRSLYYVAQVIERMTGHKSADLLQSKVGLSIMMHPDDVVPVYEVILQAAKSMKNYSVVYRVVTASGDVRPILEVGQPVTVGQGDIVINGMMMFKDQPS